MLKGAIPAEATLPTRSLIYVPGAPGTIPVPNEKVAIFCYVPPFPYLCAGEDKSGGGARGPEV